MSTQIIILAAGHGKRMESEVPKALTILQGKPFLVHVLETIKSTNICKNPIIVIGQKKDQIMDLLGAGYSYAVQSEQLGTGHAVMITESIAHNADSTLVLYADHPLISADTIKNIVNTHEKTKAIITMATATVPDFDDWRQAFLSFGRFVRDENGNISKIIEAKDATEQEKNIKEVNPAYMCFHNAWLWPHLHALENQNAQNEYYLTDLVGMAFSENQKIATIAIDAKEALGVNTKDQLITLEKVLGL